MAAVNKTPPKSPAEIMQRMQNNIQNYQQQYDRLRKAGKTSQANAEREALRQEQGYLKDMQSKYPNGGAPDPTLEKMPKVDMGTPSGAQPPAAPAPGATNQLPGTGVNVPQTGGPLYNPGQYANNIAQNQPPVQSNFDAFKPQETGARPLQQNIYDQASNILPQFNQAADRIRERLQTETQGQQAKINASTVGGAGRASGRNMYLTGQNNANQLSAYGNALTNLSSQFENFRQQGLQTALGATNQISQEGMQNNQLGAADLTSRRGLENANNQFNNAQSQQNAQYLDSLLSGIMSNREGLANQRYVADANNQSQEKIAAGSNATNTNIANNRNDLERQLQELLQKNQNYRTSIEMGANKDPSLIQVPSNTNYSSIFNQYTQVPQYTQQYPQFNYGRAF